MVIPDKIKIGGFDVEVKLKENIVVDRHHGGEYSPRELTIYLDPALKKGLYQVLRDNDIDFREGCE